MSAKSVLTDGIKLSFHINITTDEDELTEEQNDAFQAIADNMADSIETYVNALIAAHVTAEH